MCLCIRFAEIWICACSCITNLNMYMPILLHHKFDYVYMSCLFFACRWMCARFMHPLCRCVGIYASVFECIWMCACLCVRTYMHLLRAFLVHLLCRCMDVYATTLHAYGYVLDHASIMQKWIFYASISYFISINGKDMWMFMPPFCRHLGVYISFLHYMHSLCRFMDVYLSILFCIYMNICIIYAHDKSHVLCMI